MFRQVKSVIFWSLLYRFRRRLSLVVALLAAVGMSQWIYADLVEYLQLTDQTHYLKYILPAKWLMIFFNIVLSAYLVLTLFKSDTPKKKSAEPKAVEKSDLSDREKDFMRKKLRSKAEMLLEK